MSEETVNGNVSYHGALQPHRFPWVLRHIFLDRATGTLRLDRPGEELHLVFNDGELTTARSSQEGQRLGERLVRRGLLSREELAQALEMRGSEPGERFGAALVRTHLLSRAVLFEELSAHVREIAFAAFEWPSVSYSFQSASEPIDPDVELGISTAEIIVEAIRRMPADDRFVEALGDDSRVLIVQKDPYSRYDALSLKPDEAYLLSLCDGHTSVRDVLRAAGPARRENARTLFALVSCGLLELTAEAKAVAPDNEPIPDFTPEVREQRRRISEFAAKLDARSSLEILGLPDGPLTSDQIEEAFQTRALEFRPELRRRAEFRDLERELERIYVAVADACRRLLQEERAAQAAARAEVARMAQVPEKPVADPEVRANLARENYKAAKKKFEAGDSYGAIVLLEEAVRIAPFSSEYRFWLGRALARNPKWRERALAQFEAALEIRPDRTDVALESAIVLRDLGNAARAREIAAALAKRHPDDPRFSDFLSECGDASKD